MQAIRTIRVIVLMPLFLLAGALFLGTGATAAAQETVLASRAPRFLFAASPRVTPVEVDANRTAALRQVVSLTVDHPTVGKLLASIEQQTSLRFAFSRMSLAADRPVALRADTITVGAALISILMDTGMDVLLSPGGQVVLVERKGWRHTPTGSIVGRVAEHGTNAAVTSAQVTVAGTGLMRFTDEKGQYRIANVPLGEQEIRVKRLGFEQVSRKVHVGDGETITADFSMVRVPTALTEVVTTATGERSRLEVGNSIGTIKADSLVPTTLVRTMSDLLQARTPGVIVTNGTGAVGSTSRIRIRGISSLQLNNDPIIVLDGVRLNWLNTSAVGIGGGSQTNTGLNMAMGATVLGGRIDDIDPNTIESIDVLRGPSAATLYGTEAANGVIVIKTKKGVPGTWRLNLLADDGWSGYGSFPAQWRAWGVTATGAETNSCVSQLLAGISAKSYVPCHLDSVSAPWVGENNPDLTTLATGTARNVSVNVSGGSQQLQEFLSFRGSNQVGVEKLSDVEQRRIQRMWGVAAPSWMTRPNAEQDWDGSSRTTMRMSPALDLQLSAQGIYRTVQGAGTAVGSGRAYLGPWDTLAVLLGENLRVRGTGLIKRGFVSANTNYVPASWLTLNATLGGDYTLRSDNKLLPASACTVLLAPSTGCASSHTNDRGETFVTTMNVGAQFSFAPRPWLGLRTALGEQYSGTTFYELSAASSGSTNLAFGTDLLTPSPIATSGTPQLFSVAESRDQSASAGYYVEQTIAIRERLFLTAAFRQDAASAFGPATNRSLPTYPKFSASWLASDESWFPFKSVLSSLRLRAAYGHSGNQARETDVLPNYTIATTLVDDPTPLQGVVLSQIPNPVLKPERTTEAEGGFDLSLFDHERVHVEATLYRKLSKDAIVSTQVANSLGATGINERINVGSVENRGAELSVTVKLADMRSFGWDVAVNYTENQNTLVAVSAMVNQISSNNGAYMWGYPLFGLWRGSSASYYDLNGDGILEGNEFALSSGTPGVPAGAAGGFVFVGPPYPKGEITYKSGFTLFSGAVHVNALFDQVNDVLSINQQLGTQCVTLPAACTLAQQNMAITTLVSPFIGNGSLVNNVSYLRFSELSATVNLPKVLARELIRARSAAVTFAGRNLALWSNAIWKDPAFSQSAARDDFPGGGQYSSMGQPRNWTLRFNVEF